MATLTMVVFETYMRMNTFWEISEQQIINIINN